MSLERVHRRSGRRDRFRASGCLPVPAAILMSLALVPPALGSVRPEGAPAIDPGRQIPTATTSEGNPGDRTPAQPVFLFDSGTPSTSPFDMCGDCYAWSSTYHASTGNYDLTGRPFPVVAGSYAYAIRLWWVYGADGPYDPYRNHGGRAADFSRIGVDLYDRAPQGGPGAFIASLDGTWTTLNADSHYREYTLTTPYVFSGSDYYLVLRPETARTNYDATILWLACAPHDAEVDYENASNGIWSTGGWDPYTEDNTPYNPCPRDMDFGLQILGFSVPDGVDAIPLDPCLTSESCTPVAFDFHRVDTTPVRGYSVTLQLDPRLRMCPEADSVAEGTYLRNVGTTSFQVLYNGNGSYTVDCAILGTPCGATGIGDLFTVRVAKQPGSPDGPAEVGVSSVLVRDCGNHPVPAFPGSTGRITIATQPPPAIADLRALQLKTGNSPPPPQQPLETTRIQVEFTPPDQGTVELYRAPFGNYPEYDDPPGSGSVPQAPSYPPAFPWTKLTGVQGSPYVDRPVWRDVWYYVAFVKDACGNLSAASDLTEGCLNYHLGDVSRGVPPLCSGNNRVSVEDISLLGAHYGTTEGTDSLYLACLDVGPTVDQSVDTRPVTDNQIEFEDLMIFSMNFNEVGFDGGTIPGDLAGSRAEHPRLTLALDPPAPEVPRTSIRAHLYLSGNTGSVKGIHAVLRYDRRVIDEVEADEGKLLEAGGPLVFFWGYPRDGCFAVDAAAIGEGAVLSGSGEVATVTFRVKPGTDAEAGKVWLQLADLRDARNHPLADAPESAGRGTDAGTLGSGAPTSEAPAGAVGNPHGILLDARPNPSQGAVEISFALLRPARVRLEIFDVSGRRVRLLVDKPWDGVVGRTSWDGRGDDGRPTGPGIYLLRMTAGTAERNLKLHLYR